MMGAARKRPRTQSRRPADAEERWFEVYRELREELRNGPDLPADYSAVRELAKLGMRADIGPALAFLCHKEVAAYTYPRMVARELPSQGLPGLGPAGAREV